MLRKLNYLLYVVLLFFNIKCIKTFNVKFNYNYNLREEPFNAQIYKRELKEFFDKGNKKSKTYNSMEYFITRV